MNIVKHWKVAAAAATVSLMPSIASAAENLQADDFVEHFFLVDFDGTGCLDSLLFHRA